MFSIDLLFFSLCFCFVLMFYADRCWHGYPRRLRTLFPLSFSENLWGLNFQQHDEQRNKNKPQVEHRDEVITIPVSDWLRPVPGDITEQNLNHHPISNKTLSPAHRPWCFDTSPRGVCVLSPPVCGAYLGLEGSLQRTEGASGGDDRGEARHGRRVGVEQLKGEKNKRAGN